MARHIQPMPPEADRHLMIRSYGDQEPLRPEPASRSPSPDLPLNFVPEAPKDSSNFPACSNIINVIERMSGGVRASEQIIVPAYMWDRNNTHWEHKMIQLKRKHRKELMDKEAEVRIKYDLMYSDSRYREQLLAKEMKELEFTKEVTDGIILGKTWKEHKAARKDMEERYVDKIEKIEKELAKSQSSREELLKTLAEKQTAIEALEKAIGKRDEQAVLKQPMQPLQFVQPQQIQQPQELQQLQPQYYSQQHQGPNSVCTPTQNNLNNFQMAQAIFQQAVSLPYAQQQQQQQQQKPENAMTLYARNHPLIAPQLQPPVTKSAFLGESSFSGAGGPSYNNINRYDSGLGYRNDSQGYQGKQLHSRDNSSQLVSAPPAPETAPRWNSAFATPQTPQIDTRVVTNQSVLVNDTGPRATYGLSGPFGSHDKALVRGKPFGNPTSRLGATNEKERSGEGATNSIKAPPPFLNLRVSKHNQSPQKNDSQPATVEKAESQKRPHSVLSTGGPTRLQASNEQQAGEPQCARQIDSSEDEDDGEANAFPKKRKYHQGQSTTTRPSKDDGKLVPRASGIRPSIVEPPPKKNVQNNQVDSLRKRVQRVGTELEKNPIHANSLSKYETLNAISKIIQASRNGKRAMVVALKRGLGWTGPAYIITKVRGGQLESVKVMENQHKVYIKFVNPNPAQVFYDFFNKEPDASQADNRFKMDVKWTHNGSCEIPRELAEAIVSGATRCLRIFQVSKDKRPEDIKIDLSPDEEPWNITDFTIDDDTSGRKSGSETGKVAKIDFSSIKLAIETKGRIEEGLVPGYENCDVEYSEDPSASKEGVPCSMSYYRTW